MRLEDLKLIQEFKNIYCLYSVVHSVEHNISELILYELPINIVKEVEYVTIDSDFPDYLYLRINAATRVIDQVYDVLCKVYPDFEWEKDVHQNVSDVILRLDDDVIAYLPQFLYEE